MKHILLALVMVAFTSAGFAEDKKEEPKKEVTAVQNDNCVKKDKKGNCPPPPKSPKPTPKKKAEAK